jgi:hypothetical protein
MSAAGICYHKPNKQQHVNTASTHSADLKLQCSFINIVFLPAPAVMWGVYRHMPPPPALPATKIKHPGAVAGQLSRRTPPRGCFSCSISDQGVSVTRCATPRGTAGDHTWAPRGLHHHKHMLYMRCCCIATNWWRIWRRRALVHPHAYTGDSCCLDKTAAPRVLPHSATLLSWMSTSEPTAAHTPAAAAAAHMPLAVGPVWPTTPL